MKEKLLRETITRVGPKGTATGGPESASQAGKDVAGAIDAYRRNDRDALERHLRSAATYAAVRLLDRRAASADGSEDAESEDGGSGLSIIGSGSESGSDVESDVDDTDHAASDSRLLTLPRVALVAAVAAVGYVLVSRYRDEKPVVPAGDQLIDDDDVGGAGGAPDLDTGADDTAAADVDVDTPDVTTEAVEGDVDNVDDFDADEAEASVVGERDSEDETDAEDGPDIESIGDDGANDEAEADDEAEN